MTAAASARNKKALEIHPQIKRHCARLRPMLKESESDLARAKHELGLLVIEVTTSSRFGNDAVGQIKAELGIGRRTLYRCASVATSFPRSEFSALLSRVNRHGLPLTWSHFVTLSDLSATRRLALAERALQHALTVRQLRRMVEGRSAQSRDRATRMAEHAQALIARVHEWEKQLSDGAPASRTAQFARSLREARKSYGHLLLACQKLIVRIDAGLTRAR